MLKYGNSKGKVGYWSYDHMFIQLEDCLDMLTIMNKKIRTFSYLTTRVVMTEWMSEH